MRVQLREAFPVPRSPARVDYNAAPSRFYGIPPVLKEKRFP
jgi:hypothetical protein